MPFYEYECSDCKFYTEVMQKIADAPLTKCPSCGKKALVKLVSAPNFRLKGAGWYETDFKDDKENRRNLAGAEEESKSDAPATGSADADTTKGETTKAEPAKAESVQGEAAKSDSKPAVRTTGGKSAGTHAKPRSGSASTESRGGHRGSSGSGRPASQASGKGARPAKPAARVSASKKRPAPAVRAKARTSSARKKARR